jgi:hypothetical protein
MCHEVGTEAVLFILWLSNKAAPGAREVTWYWLPAPALAPAR